MAGPQFDPAAAAMLGGGFGGVGADMLPSKQEQRRAAAMNVAVNLVCAEHSTTRLDREPEKAGTQLVGIAKVIAKFLDSGN